MKRAHLVLAASVIVLGIMGCSQSETQSGNDNTAKNELIFESGDGIATSTRTSCTPVYTETSGIADFNFFWEPNDHIWVNGTTVSNDPIINTSNNNLATFTVTNSPEPTYVAYTGSGSTSGTSVTIPTTQTQANYTPVRLATAHIGTDGDCGVDTVSKISNDTYKFSLNHKASYLMLLPRISGTTYSGYYLSSILVKSYNNNIAGTYELDANGLKNGTNLSNTITLNTGNFPLKTSKNDAYAYTASYLVIAPTTSTTKFGCIYTITNGSITKKIVEADVQFSKCEAGKMYYITADLNSIYTVLIYTIKYDANGGTGAPSDEMKAEGINMTLSSTIPTPPSGYSFLGWSTSPTATTATFTPGQTVSDADLGHTTGSSDTKTLYAVWQKEGVLSCSYVKTASTSALGFIPIVGKSYTFTSNAISSFTIKVNDSNSAELTSNSGTLKPTFTMSAGHLRITGIADVQTNCPTSLCNNSAYKNIMKNQCGVACGFIASSITITGVTSSDGGCQ